TRVRSSAASDVYKRQAMNKLEGISTVFERSDVEVFVDEGVRIKAMKPLTRMLDFAQSLKLGVKGNA
ncbi:MAG: hypothetical protein KUG73_08330, partial [Pseudomonadales bacterium]|nr:hypothetical protein [Pseudomonadales bacterium]